MVKMAHLAIVGSHSVNGVAALHSEIIKRETFREFYGISPEKFNNKTNGVSHRRWLIQSNPELSRLICEAIGDGWITETDELEKLLPFRDNPGFLSRLSDIKRVNKKRLADYIYKSTNILVDPESVFDVQVKRLHAYKRQLMNAFKILDLYNRIKADPNADVNPCTFIFSAKAAQGYAFAKEVIKYINSVADLVNSDPAVAGRLKVIFLENFCVSLGQLIYPAADISEQISTAGKEASGTGNMKFMMNGAITLGTLDGANIEILGCVGRENMKIFGIDADEAARISYNHEYDPETLINSDPRIRKLMEQLTDGTFSASGYSFWAIRDAMRSGRDEFFVLKDLGSYIEAWEQLTGLYYADKDEWNRIALTNIAKSGFFSSDRTIGEYAKDIWNVNFERR
jgi:starch phosphorylase